jgi:hypothetical protein
VPLDLVGEVMDVHHRARRPAQLGGRARSRSTACRDPHQRRELAVGERAHARADPRRAPWRFGAGLIRVSSAIDGIFSSSMPWRA